ncbi:MAG: DUF294 nucleotidyltransferase-like domain-containing protein, partial [Burkholderiales bacterium]
MSDPIRKITPQLALSRWAVERLAARPELAMELEEPRAFGSDEIAAALSNSRQDDEAEFKRRLRRLRERVLLRTMARDLEGRAKLAEVCRTMSELADACIRACLEWLAQSDPATSDLIVVAMGKLGGGELNVSSDIDLVFVHPDAADPQRLERAGRKLIALLGDRTEDGFVFRVDMRLRPYG